MNRNRRPMPQKTRKALEKEVKEGQKKLTTKKNVAKTDTLTPKAALAKYPAKRKKIEKPLVDAVVKKMEVAKKKNASNTSKRTTPGEVDHRETPPAYEHREGARWEKTTKLQNKGSRKALTQKLQKQRAKTPKPLRAPASKKKG